MKKTDKPRRIVLVSATADDVTSNKFFPLIHRAGEKHGARESRLITKGELDEFIRNAHKHKALRYVPFLLINRPPIHNSIIIIHTAAWRLFLSHTLTKKPD